jgi:hypothetical protein
MTLFALLLATSLAEASNVWTCNTTVEVVAHQAGNRGVFTFDGQVKTAKSSPECDGLVGNTYRIVLEPVESEVGTVLSLEATLADHEEVPETSILGWKRLEASSDRGCSTVPSAQGARKRNSRGVYHRGFVCDVVLVGVVALPFRPPLSSGRPPRFR